MIGDAGVNESWRDGMARTPSKMRGALPGRSSRTAAPIGADHLYTLVTAADCDAPASTSFYTGTRHEPDGKGGGVRVCVGCDWVPFSPAANVDSFRGGRDGNFPGRAQLCGAVGNRRGPVVHVQVVDRHQGRPCQDVQRPFVGEDGKKGGWCENWVI